jgi:hypothetical protein
LLLGLSVIMEPLQALALRTTGDALADIGLDQMHIFFEPGNDRHAQFFADAALDGQADITEIAHHPLRQPVETVLALAQARMKEKYLAPIGWHRPGA